jgi:hypothetical protein
MRGASLADQKQYEFDTVFNPSVNGSQEDVRSTASRAARASTEPMSHRRCSRPRAVWHRPHATVSQEGGYPRCSA